MSKEKAISIDEAYDAAVNFLNKYYTNTESDDIGMLAGDMHLLEDNCSADSAAQSGWQDSIYEDAFTLFFNFLGEYIEKNDIPKVAELRASMFSEGETPSTKIWDIWSESVYKELHKRERY